MKTKQHRFVLTVKTTRPKASARLAALTSFAMRNPDGCEFSVIDLSTFQRNRHRKIMRACEEARKRMNGYTPEQRAELGNKARAIIAKAKAIKSKHQDSCYKIKHTLTPADALRMANRRKELKR